MNALMAIAMLCGNPTNGGLTQEQVLACQKYYVNCAGDLAAEIPAARKIKECITKKQSLGGDK